MTSLNQCPDIDHATISFLFEIGNRFLIFDHDGILIYSSADREAAEVARDVLPQASSVAEIRQLQGEIALSFGIEVAEIFS